MRPGLGWGCALLGALMLAGATQAAPCAGTLYLTLDTGSMSQAENIARILNKHQVKATFFLANEKTVNGDSSLDDGWAPYWRARVAEGHAFGSHTFDHVYFRKGDEGSVSLGIPSQGPETGRRIRYDETRFCTELNRVRERFARLTGRQLDPLWRAPGGYTTPNTLRWASRCGYRHIHWAPAGFLGDELPSERYPNETLLARALSHIRDGDILMMHLGIWSRKDPFAPMLDPLIAGLKEKGYCFALLPDTRPAP